MMAVKVVQEAIPRGPVRTEINYYQGPVDGSVPYNFVDNPPPNTPERNFTETAHCVTIQDMRGHESDFTLDHDSFTTISGLPPSAESDFVDDIKIKQNYYPEVEALLKTHIPDVAKVFIFDHTIRSIAPGSPRPPLTRAHLDQTPRSAVERVRFHLPDEADALLQRRFRIVNVWRPINGPVVEFPLGLVSAASTSEDDFVGIRHIYPDREGETGGVKFNQQHEWWYWSGIGNDERILLQCFDSEAAVKGSGVIGGRAPHSAFVDPRTPKGVDPRKSIEVRALVFC